MFYFTCNHGLSETCFVVSVYKHRAYFTSHWEQSDDDRCDGDCDCSNWFTAMCGCVQKYLQIEDDPPPSGSDSNHSSTTDSHSGSSCETQSSNISDDRSNEQWTAVNVHEHQQPNDTDDIWHHQQLQQPEHSALSYHWSSTAYDERGQLLLATITEWTVLSCSRQIIPIIY